MSGAQTVPLRGYGGGKYSLAVSAKPLTWWRFVPIVGAAWMFRLGAKVQFLVEIKCTGINPVEESLEREQAHIEAQLLQQGKPVEFMINLAFVLGDEGMRRPDTITFSVPLRVGDRWRRQLPPIFLERTGDAVLRVMPGGGGWDSLYSFHVSELAMVALNWIMALLAAFIGGAIGTLLTWWLRHA